VSAESVPSLISNLTLALYGQIQKDVSGGKVVWIIPCDPNNTAFIGSVPRLPGEGLLCYFIRYFNTVYPQGILAIAYGGTGAGTAQAALSNLGGTPTTRQIITAPSSGLSGGGTLAADRSLSITNTTVVPGTYGANNRIPVLTVNARGQLTGATTVAAEGFASVDGEVITAADPSPNVRQTVFNLTTITYSPGTDNLAVYRNGIRLLLGQDYTETNSNTVTLTRGVAAGNQLLFESGRIIGQDVSSVAVATQRIVAANPAPGIQQTVFNLTAITYVPGNNSLAVYRNGLKLDLGADYVETNSTTVTLTAGATAGDQFTFEAGKMLSQPVSATVQTQTITSSLGQDVFALALSYTPNIGNLAVYQDGLRLISGTDYAETNSNTVTLTTPALAGRQFMFEVGKTLAQPAPVAAASELKTATASQTQFTLTGLTYVPNTLSLSVYRNGLKLVVGTDYTETNSNTVTLTSPAALGDQLVFEAGRILTNALAGTSVSFQQAGTGAISRNMQDKARESVSVKDFGAVGDGLVNDAPAIQAALDYVNSLGGGVVYVPASSAFYNLNAALQIGSNTTLSGDGMGASKLKWTSLPPTPAPGDGDPVGTRRAIVNKNLSLSGTANSNISIQSLKIDLSLIVGALSYSRQAIFFFNCSFTSVRNCHILSDGGCVLNVKVSNYIVDSNHCEQAGTYASSDGMIDQWWGSSNGIISKNYINGNLLCISAILITGSDTVGGIGGAMSNIKFSDNIIKNAGKHGIWVEGRIDTVQRIDIVKNTIDVCGDGTAGGFGYGIRLMTCDGVVVSQNQVTNCQASGLFFTAQQGESWTRNGTNYIVSNNVIKNVGLYRTSGSLTTYDGIESYYTNSVQIIANQISPLSTALYEYAIQIDTTASNAVIAENIIVPGYYADSINFGTNQTIKLFRNVGFKTETFGEATITAGSSTVIVTGIGLNFNPSASGSPYFISITPLNQPANMASLGAPIVTNVSQSQFQVLVSANVASNFVFRWSISRL